MPSDASKKATDPADERLARLVDRLADENRILLGLMRIGWSLDEVEIVLRGGRRPTCDGDESRRGPPRPYPP